MRRRSPWIRAGTLGNVPPPSLRMALCLEVAHPRGYRPLGAAGLPPPSLPAAIPIRLVSLLTEGTYFHCALLFA